jgi:hypothetical protein
MLKPETPGAHTKVTTDANAANIRLGMLDLP